MASLGDFIRSTIDQRITQSQASRDTVVNDVVVQESQQMGVVTHVEGSTVTVKMSDGRSVTAYAGPAQFRVRDRVTVAGNRVFG